MAISAELGATLEAFVNQLVESGRYNSKSEVLREGVRIIQDREARLLAFDRAIAQGIADEEAGRVKPMDEVFDRLETKYRKLASKSTAA